MVTGIQQNPYITDPTLTAGYRNVDGGTDKLIGGVKAVGAATAVAGAIPAFGVGATRTVVWEGGKRLLNNMPITGWMIPDSSVGNMADGAINGAGGFLSDSVNKIGGVQKVLGAAVAVGYGVKAINELRAGDAVGAAGQVARGVGEGFITAALMSTGIGAVAELATWAFTGKPLSKRLGDIVENATEGTLNGIGGVAKGATNFISNNPGKSAAIVGAAAIPAAVAVSRNGYGQNVGGSQLHFNAPPPGAQRVAAVQSAPQQIEEQYTSNTYGKSPTHFQDMVNAQRGGQQPQVAVASGDAAFSQKLLDQRAQQMLAQNGITG